MMLTKPKRKKMVRYWRKLSWSNQKVIPGTLECLEVQIHKSPSLYIFLNHFLHYYWQNLIQSIPFFFLFCFVVVIVVVVVVVVVVLLLYIQSKSENADAFISNIRIMRLLLLNIRIHIIWLRLTFAQLLQLLTAIRI